jgi:GTP cyclohydrolase I
VTDPVPTHPRPDRDAIESAVASLLIALGRDASSERLAATPARVADSLLELLTPPSLACTTFPNDDGYTGLVLVRDIRFVSMCEHHLLPFEGVAHVGYLPGAQVIGLSTLARVVEHFAKDLQLQERMTVQIARWIQDRLDARGVGVVIEADHQCMSARGAKAVGTRTITSCFFGALEDSPSERARFGQNN